MYIANLPPVEVSYHSDGVVQIGDGWASFSGKHYRLREIQKVELVKTASDILIFWVFLYFVVLTIFLALSSLISPLGSRTSNASFVQVPACIYMLGTFIVLVMLYRRWNLSRKLYILRLAGIFGQVNALTSLEEKYIKQVTWALQRAVKDAEHLEDEE